MLMRVSLSLLRGFPPAWPLLTSSIKSQHDWFSFNIAQKHNSGVNLSFAISIQNSERRKSLKIASLRCLTDETLLSFSAGGEGGGAIPRHKAGTTCY